MKTMIWILLALSSTSLVSSAEDCGSELSSSLWRANRDAPEITTFDRAVNEHIYEQLVEIKETITRDHLAVSDLQFLINRKGDIAVSGTTVFTPVMADQAATHNEIEFDKFIKKLRR